MQINGSAQYPPPFFLFLYKVVNERAKFRNNFERRTGNCYVTRDR